MTDRVQKLLALLKSNAYTELRHPTEVILSPEEEYQVTLSLPASSSSGYCLISAGAVEYYTDYILRHDEELPQTVTFTLTVAEATNVTFTPRWGIYSGESSVIEGILNIQ